MPIRKIKNVYAAGKGCGMTKQKTSGNRFGVSALGFPENKINGNNWTHFSHYLRGTAFALHIS
jgi:hypothetical protein